MIVHLLPVGHGRFELYAEPPAAPPATTDVPAEGWRAAVQRAGQRWQAMVDAARTAPPASGTLARWRDRGICALADALDAQRTLWSLRTQTSAVLLYPSSIEPAAARAILNGILEAARKHHGRWLGVDVLLFVLSGILFFVPGPNIVAYYIGFRAYGHLQSWRGARQGRTAVAWDVEASDALAELTALADMPHPARAARVDAIAAALALPHLPAFFERAAA